MKKLIKILFWTIVSLVLIVVPVAILIPVLVDPNDYKDEIAQQVQDQTGRTLTIEGDIDLSISFPLSVSLELGKTELSNAPGFTDKPFAKIQNASLYVAIMPLLTENTLNIGEIKLIGMELNLIKNKQGQNNWADLSAEKEKPSSSSKQANAPSAPASKSTTSSSTMPAIKVAGLTISDAHISWTDEQNNQKVSLSKTNISLSELIENKPVDLRLSTNIDSNNPAIKGTFALESAPVIAVSQQLFKLPKTKLDLDLTGELLPGGANKTSLGGDIIFDGKAQKLDISNMKLTSYDMVINGSLKANKLDSSPTFNGQVSIDSFSPKKLAALLGAALPKMKEDKALNSADVQMTFSGTKDSLNISTLEANLDDVTLNGNAAITNFQKPHYGFDLALNQLNLDYYALAETSEKEKTSAPAANKESPAKTDSKKAPVKKSSAMTSKKTSPAKSTPIFPIETLRLLNLDGKLSIKKFIAGGAKMSNVVIVLKGKDGLVKLAPLTGDLYNGSINLQTDIDARNNTPQLKIVNELKNVQIGDLLQDTTGSQEFTGAANISANITSAGNYTDQLTKNSDGTVNLLVTDGNIKKLDIISTLRKAQALYRGTAAPSTTEDENTKFTELKGTFKINKGVVNNNDLFTKTPVMEFTGAGYADLVKEYMDYTLTIKLLNSLKISDDTKGTDFKGKEIPYTIKGKFSELSQDANLSKVLEKEVKKTLEKKINKELEKKFGDKFKGLIKF